MAANGPRATEYLSDPFGHITLAFIRKDFGNPSSAQGRRSSRTGEGGNTVVTREPYEGHPLTKLVIPSVKLAHGAADGPSFVHQHLKHHP